MPIQSLHSHGRSTSHTQDKILHDAASRLCSLSTAHDVVFFGTDMAGLALYGAEAAGNAAAVATLTGNAAGVAATSSLAIVGPLGLGASAVTGVTLGLRRFAKSAAHWGMLREIKTAKVVECSCKQGSVKCPEVLSYIISQKRTATRNAAGGIALAPAPGAMVLYRVSKAIWKACRGQKGKLRRAMASSLYWASRGHSSKRDGRPIRSQNGACPMAVEIIHQLFCGSPYTMLMRDALQGDDSNYGEYGRAIKHTNRADEIIGEGETRGHHQGENKTQIDKIFAKLSS